MAYQVKTHVVSAAQLARAEPTLYRLIGAGLWLLSYFGNVLTFNNAPRTIEALLTTLDIMDFVYALLWQLACTGIQLVTCKRRGVVYWLALLASSVPSFLGYRPLVAVPIAEALSGAVGDAFTSVGVLLTSSLPAILWSIIVSVVVFVVFVVVDMLPERIYVQH